MGWGGSPNSGGGKRWASAATITAVTWQMSRRAAATTPSTGDPNSQSPVMLTNKWGGMRTPPVLCRNL